MPLDYAETWDAAAETVVSTLITRIGTAFDAAFDVPLAAERTLCLDYLPPRIKVAAFFMGGGTNVAHNWHEAAPKELVMDARFEARFDRRQHARAFGMMLLSALPMQRIGTLVELRIAGNPQINADVVRLANDTKDGLYWKLSLSCLCVFRTDGVFT